jgi:excisionase family DNA binding protein
MSSKRTVVPSRVLVSIAEAAKLADVHPRTVRRRIADGTLTAYKLGPRLIRIDAAQLDSLLTPIPSAGAQ